VVFMTTSEEKDAPLKSKAVTSKDNSNGAIISVRALWKVYGETAGLALEPKYLGKNKQELQTELGLVVALHDVSFDVEKGETFVVMGLSGSGKSTLVRSLIGLVEPTAGEILVEGMDILQYDDAAMRAFRRNKIAMVFQQFGLLPHRRVLDNAAWGLEIQGIDKKTRHAKTMEVLELVGLKGWEHAYPRELSGGMQQRVGLARALAVDPDILLMDEPFSGLDPLIRRNLQDELLRLQQELHKTLIFITHDLSEALKLGDRIAIMRDGVVVQVGSPEDIVLAPEDEYVGAFTQDVRVESVLNTAAVMGRGRAVIMDYQGPRAALYAMRSNDSPLAIVVNLRGKYQGVLTLEQAVVAARAGDYRILSYLRTDTPTATPETPMDELVQLSLGAEQIIPVLDDTGSLVGEVRRTALASLLSAPREETGSGQVPTRAATEEETERPNLDQVALETIDAVLESVEETTDRQDEA
jgi:glycine betaine/proline transport system ATP-binding protein